MTYLLAQADVIRLPLSDKSVDFCFGSPPYIDARLYLENGINLGIARNLTDWVEWMLEVTTECLRVTRGAVVWIAAGKTEDRNYWPACEGLMWEWHKRGGHAYRPCYWHRVGIPGSGGDQWFRSDIEHVMCFKRPGPLPWTDNTTMGHAPKYGPGGAMSHRDSAGKRRNQWGGTEKSAGHRKRDGSKDKSVRPSPVIHTVRCAAGNMEEQSYAPPTLANPGNLIQTTVGGGQLGSALAHENEAPFPESLAEHFIRSLCPPCGTTLDPFSGSGTTAAVAHRLDRIGLGFDLRRSQCELSARRIPAGMKPVSKLDPAKAKAPLVGQLSMFD